ncbi:MAG: DUF512 domain-containing protein [Thermacetogeniaceae bacterium]
MLEKKKGVRIVRVRPGSVAARIGICPGDCLLTVNGVVPRDLIEYLYLAQAERVWLKIRKHENGRIDNVVIEKDEDEDLGLVFEADCFDGIIRCRNKCIFCFVDQLPPGLRGSLYVKDDDYRLSFLHGNFVTLTDLAPRDLRRILTFHLSPLYISVHTTDPVLRGKMLGRKKPMPILDKIELLAQKGITMHIQIVLCPDWNDGEVLTQTIEELSRFWPRVASVGIVPVGLTKYRDGLAYLRSFTKAECRSLIRKIAIQQNLFRIRYKKSFVYLADEFYLRGGLPFPPAHMYDNFPQLENGIGCGRLLYEEFRKLKPLLPKRLTSRRSFVVATGKAGASVLAPVIARLNLIENVRLKLLAIPSTFFGPRITVAGLLTGRDLIWGLRRVKGESVLLPNVSLRHKTSVFLDGMTVDEVSSRCGCKIHVIEPTAKALVEAVLGKRLRF